MADEIIDQLGDVEQKLTGITDRFMRMHEVLKAKIESPEIKKYIQQASASREQTMKSDFFVIGAACKNNGIGFRNRLPWKLKKEMAYFDEMTSSSPEPSHKNIVIMGRKTWSSIPPKYRPLKNRTNVVLSRQVSTIEDRESVDHIFSSLPDALEGVSQLRNKGQVWVIGGQAVYEEALRLPQYETIYKVTKVEEQEEEGVRYDLMVYDRV